MNADLKDIPAKIIPQLKRLRKYVPVFCIVAVVLIYLIVFWQIRSYANVEPTATDVTTKLNELNTPRLDQDAIDKMLQLESRNIEVQSLFNEARQNPFQE